MEGLPMSPERSVAAAAIANTGLPTPLISYRVQVLGAPGVGKSTLCRQFMSSEVLEVYNDLGKLCNRKKR